MSGVAFFLLLVSWIWWFEAAAEDQAAPYDSPAYIESSSQKWAMQTAPAGARIPPDEIPNANRDASIGFIEKVMSSAPESREDRETTKWMGLLAFAYFDTWVPSKVGVALVHNFSASDSLEFGFDRGSVGYDSFPVSIGKVSDDRFSLVWRHFGPRNSFNYFVGLHHSSLRIKLDDDLLASVAASQQGGVNVIEMATTGPVLGVGNRWQTRGGFVWSFDWLVINLPLWDLKSRTPILDATSSRDDRDNIENVLQKIRNAPTGAIFKVQLGYAF